MLLVIYCLVTFLKCYLVEAKRATIVFILRLFLVSSSAFHPRNRHQGRYDFTQLIKASPELARFMITNPYGKPSIDFANPQAVLAFNKALLKSLYQLQFWQIPEGYLCPPVPGRADYVHAVADVLAADGIDINTAQSHLKILDVGTGANCIYPLLAHLDYGWQVVGTDIDPIALKSAIQNVQKNNLQQHIELRLQKESKACFSHVIHSNERFIMTLCNPPFHSNAQEAASGSERKWRNLGKLDPQRKLPALNFGGKNNELWCAGGEVAFVRRMIKDSKAFAQQVLWFSCLLSKQDNVRQAKRALADVHASEIKVVSMAQGQKQSRFIAWSFMDVQQRKLWLSQL